MNQTVMISLQTIDDVKTFAAIVTKHEGDFDLLSGKYVVDAKSLLGIFSLDLSKPLRLDISCATAEVMQELEPYLIK